MQNAEAAPGAGRAAAGSLRGVREAGKRVLGMRHFDVQLIGGMVRHEAQIAEMKTGEGKTLVATLPSYLNALGIGGHVVTVNDYLACRDAEWMARCPFLGLSVGLIQQDMAWRSGRQLRLRHHPAPTQSWVSITRDSHGRRTIEVKQRFRPV